MMTAQDPKTLVYRKYVLKYLRELMSEILNDSEETVILLHCGILTGAPVDFAEIARSLRLYSAENAEELYCRAIRKTRAAIPGSKLENWLVGYRMAHHRWNTERILIDPDMPIPRWGRTERQ